MFQQTEENAKTLERGRVTIALIAQEELIETNHSLLNSLKVHLHKVSRQVDEIPEQKLDIAEMSIDQAPIGDAIERNNRTLDEANKKIGHLIDFLEI